MPLELNSSQEDCRAEVVATIMQANMEGTRKDGLLKMLPPTLNYRDALAAISVVTGDVGLVYKEHMLRDIFAKK